MTNDKKWEDSENSSSSSNVHHTNINCPLLMTINRLCTLVNVEVANWSAVSEKLDSREIILPVL